MRLLPLLFLAVSTIATGARAGDLDICASRGVELAKRAETFNGENRMKRLIDADLKRARKEMAEGDAEECLEALDHADSLLSGRI